MSRSFATPPGTRFKKSAVEIIKEIIITKTKVMTGALKANDDDANAYFDRSLHEVKGMLTCLKNIADDDNFYTLNITDTKVEFGYYDKDSKWNVLK